MMLQWAPSADCKQWPRLVSKTPDKLVAILLATFDSPLPFPLLTIVASYLPNFHKVALYVEYGRKNKVPFPRNQGFALFQNCIPPDPEDIGASEKFARDYRNLKYISTSDKNVEYIFSIACKYKQGHKPAYNISLSFYYNNKQDLSRSITYSPVQANRVPSYWSFRTTTACSPDNEYVLISAPIQHRINYLNVGASLLFIWEMDMRKPFPAPIVGGVKVPGSGPFVFGPDNTVCQADGQFLYSYSLQGLQSASYPFSDEQFLDVYQRQQKIYGPRWESNLLQNFVFDPEQQQFILSDFLGNIFLYQNRVLAALYPSRGVIDRLAFEAGGRTFIAHTKGRQLRYDCHSGWPALCAPQTHLSDVRSLFVEEKSVISAGGEPCNYRWNREGHLRLVLSIAACSSRVFYHDHPPTEFNLSGSITLKMDHKATIITFTDSGNKANCILHGLFSSPTCVAVNLNRSTIAISGYRDRAIVFRIGKKNMTIIILGKRGLFKVWFLRLVVKSW